MEIQQDTFTANFAIIVNSFKTTTLGNMTKVVKQIEWTLKGVEGQDTFVTFELPQVTDLPDPEESSYLQFDQITEEIAATWIVQHDERIPAIKRHIQYVLYNELRKSTLSNSTPAWMPQPSETKQNANTSAASFASEPPAAV